MTGLTRGEGLMMKGMTKQALIVTGLTRGEGLMMKGMTKQALIVTGLTRGEGLMMKRMMKRGLMVEGTWLGQLMTGLMAGGGPMVEEETWLVMVGVESLVVISWFAVSVSNALRGTRLMAPWHSVLRYVSRLWYQLYTLSTVIFLLLI